MEIDITKTIKTCCLHLSIVHAREIDPEHFDLESDPTGEVAAVEDRT